MALSLRTLAVAVALIGAGCSLDPSKIKPNLPPDAVTFCQQLSGALVDLQVRCFGAERQWANRVPTLPDCTNWQKAAAGGQAAFDAVAAFDCVTAARTASCDDLTRIAFKTLPSACQRALQGTLTTQNCYDDVECPQGQYCNACPGRCQAYAGLDQDCSATTCGPGLACMDTSAVAQVRRCRPVQVVPLNALCGVIGSNPTPTAALCTEGTFCDPLSPPAVCHAQSASAICVPGSILGLPLDPQCLPGYRCAGPSGGVRTCQKALALGAACTDGYGQCAVGTYCTNGQCALYPVAGGTCGAVIPGEQAECLGASCPAAAGTTAVCVAPAVCAVP
jgi:hypothetical protein